MNVTVFCGARRGNDARYAAAARDLGALIARRGHNLVYGGGSIGLMGELAGAALLEGGQVTGVIPRALSQPERTASRLTQLVVVQDMHERKAEMQRRAEAFAVLPGGTGTFEELLEALSWKQLGLMRKPIGILDVAGYFAPFLQLLQSAGRCGFIPHDYRSELTVESEPERLLNRLEHEAARLLLAAEPRLTAENPSVEAG